MVVDECHRGYLLDREMSDAELSFRNEADYISKYRRVLEHFDAVKIGLTATPALHTVQIFGDPIFTYSYREAVIDGYLIDHDPPIRIETALSRDGIHFAKGEHLPLLDTATGEIDLTHAPDDLDFEVSDFNRQVITRPFNQVVCEELAKHIDPSLPGKTLIFAASDAHADIVVDELKKAFVRRYGEVDDAAVAKITGSVDDPGKLIRCFRNDASPTIAVTVDLLTTGIDVPKIENLVFLRRVAQPHSVRADDRSRDASVPRNRQGDVPHLRCSRHLRGASTLDRHEAGCGQPEIDADPTAGTIRARH